eukprot:CAMPEP_0115033390 /NCGR_PEP_ID=MMETSP0216-20121206/39840_1 /TAXON_ID=223996 /ORGANISM="Protocruzia adherens, Strain Boccale" /LENGTH=35 /DNA_ID= /DNA_START= /DNA_END= /DNA_ORIENTATION=
MNKLSITEGGGTGHKILRVALDMDDLYIFPSRGTK